MRETNFRFKYSIMIVMNIEKKLIKMLRIFI